MSLTDPLVDSQGIISDGDNYNSVGADNSASKLLYNE